VYLWLLKESSWEIISHDVQVKINMKVKVVAIIAENIGPLLVDLETDGLLKPTGPWPIN